MPDGFPVWDVSGWEVVHPETLGRERKVWLRETDAPTNSRERDWLFKPVVVPENGHRQGEDWAEKVVAELGGLLGVPCADVQLASREGVEGSISRNVAPDGWNLVVGANQDRHDQNWAILRQTATPGRLRLAPSYDHASGVGANLRDSYRAARISSDDVRRFAEKARAHRFEHDPAAGRAAIPTLVQAADDGLSIAGFGARAFWMHRLASVERAHTESVVRSVPGLSDLTRTFILELLDVNRERLLHECG